MRCHPLLNGSPGHESLGKRSTSQENPEQGQPAENNNAVIPAMHTRHPVQGPCTCLHVFTAVKGWDSPGVLGENCTACFSWDPEFVTLSCVNWVIVTLCRSGVQGQLQSQAFPSQWHEIMGGNSNHHDETQKRVHLNLITVKHAIRKVYTQRQSGCVS